MWRHEALKAKRWKDQPFDYAQHKLDGWRALFCRQPRTTRVLAFGRKERDDLELTSRYPALLRHPVVDLFRSLPPYTSIDCEITPRSGARTSVVTVLQDGDASAFDITAFAMPYYDGHFYPDEPLNETAEFCREMGIPFAHTFSRHELSNGYALIRPSMADTRDALLDYARRHQMEGWILKHGGQYGRWYKLKVEDTVDCVVTNLLPGKGKFSGQAGALVCSIYDKDGDLVEIASVSGMDDATRAAISRRDIGKVVEVKYQMLGAKGRLTHPRFVRWRPDKPKKECTYTQLEGQKQ